MVVCHLIVFAHGFPTWQSMTQALSGEWEDTVIRAHYNISSVSRKDNIIFVFNLSSFMLRPWTKFFLMFRLVLD